MDSAEYLSSIERDCQRIAALGARSIHARVPSCPDWDMRDLLVHVGWVCKWLAHVGGLPDGGTASTLKAVFAAERAQGRSEPEQGDIVHWFGQEVSRLVDVLERAPAHNRVHSPYGTHGPVVVARRSATEIAVHRWDADGAVGAPTPLDTALAEDGLDEFFDVLIPTFFKYGRYTGTGQRIAFESTDAEAAWIITTRADTTAWERTSGSPSADVTVRGSTSDLYLSCWGRASEQVQLIGDEHVFRHWQSAAAF